MHSSDGGTAGAIGSAMGEFAALAARGGFAVNERGGEALLSAIRNMTDWLDDQQIELRVLAQTPQLGSSANAEVMKPFLQQVATDDRGFLTQLAQLRESLAKAEEGIRQAMANYQHSDDHVANTLKGESYQP